MCLRSSTDSTGLKAGIVIITTSDGSHSLLNEDLDETYHSTHGAIQESAHVFIKNGLDFYINRHNPAGIALLEIGFGTGLNAFLTVHQMLTLPVPIHYTAIEAFPVGDDIWPLLNYTQKLGAGELFRKLHQSRWESVQQIRPGFMLLKRQTTLETVQLLPDSYDLIYFDAFSPNKQPELWTLPILEKLVMAMRKGAVFVTYCAQGRLKRSLKALGLVLETLGGPPGKREMVRGVKP